MLIDKGILINEFEIKFLQNNNPLIIFSPDHPSSEDELKWIDMSYHQSLAKENVMSQSVNHIHGGQGKFLHMRITDFRINKVSAQIIYGMLMELLILLNQNYTNYLHGHGHINQEITAIVRWTKHAKACLRASKD